MLFNLLLQNPLAFILLMGGLVISIGIHEYAHCFVTDRLGDPTPRIKGRLTLNPLKHLDPLGTLAIIFAGFGWGKAAPYDPYNLKEPVRDVALIAAAGPASNLLLATIVSILLQLGFGGSFFALFAVQLIVINVALAIFNLLPVYPLDGGKIMRALLPHQASLEYEDVMERYGTFILIMLILPWAGGQSAVSALIRPIMDVVLRMFI
jgi:Zn-dependent protease